MGTALRAFLATEAAGGLVLLVATVVALVWANSPVAASYGSFWDGDLGLSFGALDLPRDLRHWVNDALMAIFFFVVGLEIKRELVSGELNARRKAALPVFAAVGGMVVPAALYLAFNAGGEGASGWGIPMATDIAFAVGVLALLGDRIPSGLKVFLLALAIVDDIGAIVVIALFYSGGIDLGWLGGAALGLVVIVGLRPRTAVWTPVYALVGIAVWLATYNSGVHATIAGVALGLMIPVRPSHLNDTGVADRLVQLVHPWTSFVVVPLFALANAGLILNVEGVRAAVTSPVTLGVIVGLVVGKVVGIAGASWIAIRFGFGEAPSEVGRRHLLGAAALGGIGFTVSLFITGLAFDEDPLVDAAKFGVLIGSVIAGLVGTLILRPRSTSDL